MLSEQHGAVVFEREYAGSVENVFKSVLMGKADAGAMFSVELGKQPQDVKERIRTLLKTREIPSHPLCAHPRVPDAVMKEVTEALLAIARTPDGAELMKRSRMPKPTAADYARDYQSLEGIDAKGLTNWGR